MSVRRGPSDIVTHSMCGSFCLTLTDVNDKTHHMTLMTGIAVNKESSQDIFVSAVTWFRYRDPDFPTRGLTLPYMKKNLPSVVIVRGEDLISTVNTACNRTIEKLLIAKHIYPQSPPLVRLIVRAALRKKRFVLPHDVEKSHWLLTAADKAMQEWLRGVR